MALFGVSLYGPSVYGPSSDSTALGTLDLTAANQLTLTFDGDIRVNEALLDPANYIVAPEDTFPTTSIRVLEVLPLQDGSLTTRKIELRIDSLEIGTRYAIQANNLTDRSADSVAVVSFIIDGRITKLDSMLEGIPSHFDRRHSSTIRNILGAISNQDDLIGGSRKELALRASI